MYLLVPIFYFFPCSAPNTAWDHHPAKVQKNRAACFSFGMHVFWTWAPFFWTCTCFLDLAGFFSGPGGAKMWGTCLWLPVCFLDPVKKLDLHLFVLDLGTLTAKLIVPELGICFLDPRTCFVDLASIGWGGTPLFQALTLGWMWTLASSFFEHVHVFFGPGSGWGEFRYWDKMHARSCWCRGSSDIEKTKT